MGDDYKDYLFIADANTGSIYHFDLWKKPHSCDLSSELKLRIRCLISHSHYSIFHCEQVQLEEAGLFNLIFPYYLVCEYV